MIWNIRPFLIIFYIVFICNNVKIKHFCTLYKKTTLRCFFIIKMSFWNEKETKIFFKELPFYNASIEKPYININ